MKTVKFFYTPLHYFQKNMYLCMIKFKNKIIL